MNVIATTTVDNPKIKPKILTTLLLISKSKTIPINTIRIQNFNKYPFCPCCAWAFRSSKEDNEEIEPIIRRTSLLDTQKLTIERTPPTKRDQANHQETRIAEVHVITASTIQLITCIFCRASPSLSVTQASSLRGLFQLRSSFALQPFYPAK